MFARQISVFIENTPGKLAGISRILSDHGINLLSMSIADTSNFGILRFICADSETALKVVEDAGYSACMNEVLAVPVADRPGGLAAILEILSSRGISVEYMYSFNHAVDGNALVVLRTDDYSLASCVLEENGVHIFSHEEICKLC